MADENATPNPTDTPTPTSEQTPPTGNPAGERTFTQADVDRIVKERLARAAQRPAEPARPNAQPPTPKNDAPAAPAQTVDVRAEIARIRAFERAAGQYGLDADAIATLEEDFNAANPSDPAAWVQKRATAFKWKATSSSPTSTPGPTETPAPTKISPQNPPVTGSGSPANPTTITADTPILSMSESDRTALLSRIGAAAYVDRMRKEFRNVRVKFGGR